MGNQGSGGLASTPCAMCENCEYIGGGDFLCTEKYKLVGCGFDDPDLYNGTSCRYFKRITEDGE